MVQGANEGDGDEDKRGHNNTLMAVLSPACCCGHLRQDVKRKAVGVEKGQGGDIYALG